jgi:hypothetical protein
VAVAQSSETGDPAPDKRTVARTRSKSFVPHSQVLSSAARRNSVIELHGASPTPRSALSHQQLSERLAQFFDLLSAETGFDFPLCHECIRLHYREMRQEAKLLAEQNQVYVTQLDRFDSRTQAEKRERVHTDLVQQLEANRDLRQQLCELSAQVNGLSW